MALSIAVAPVAAQEDDVLFIFQSHHLTVWLSGDALVSDDGGFTTRADGVPYVHASEQFFVVYEFLGDPGYDYYFVCLSTETYAESCTDWLTVSDGGAYTAWYTVSPDSFDYGTEYLNLTLYRWNSSDEQVEYVDNVWFYVDFIPDTAPEEETAVVTQSQNTPKPANTAVTTESIGGDTMQGRSADDLANERGFLSSGDRGLTDPETLAIIGLVVSIIGVLVELTRGAAVARGAPSSGVRLSRCRFWSAAGVSSST
ncbi:hypothetical protein [Haladaptatus sp. GCM10025893]|uniref:hypothetical protein n=1 Tax=Haladaptatus sp. GCM10025893 TaxID=3252659 RepID=UPI003620CACF